MNIEEASEMMKKKLSKALNKKSEETIFIEKQENKWVANIEILEESYLPQHPNTKSANDILGVYEVSIDENGDLISWKKKESRKREMLIRSA